MKRRQTMEVRITYAYHFMGDLQGTKVGCKINDDLKLKASSKIKFSRQYKVPWRLHTGQLFRVFGSVCVVVCSYVKSTTSGELEK
jgi:hypothetical protein